MLNSADEERINPLEKLMIALSLSRWNILNECPGRFYGQYITKEFKEEISDAGQGGINDHLAIQYYIENDRELPLHLYHSKSYIDNIVTKGGDIKCEQEFSVNKNLEPTGYYDKDVVYRGKADLCQHFPHARTLFIWDWKTGKRKEDMTQLALLAALGFKYYDVDVILAAYVWLASGGATPGCSYSRELEPQLNEIIIDQMNTVTSYENNESWPFTPSSWSCRFCPVKSTCVARERSLRNVAS